MSNKIEWSIHTTSKSFSLLYPRFSNVPFCFDLEVDNIYDSRITKDREDDSLRLAFIVPFKERIILSVSYSPQEHRFGLPLISDSDYTTQVKLDKFPLKDGGFTELYIEAYSETNRSGGVLSQGLATIVVKAFEMRTYKCSDREEMVTNYLSL